MIYRVIIKDQLQAIKEIIVTTQNEIDAVAEAIVRYKCGKLPQINDPGGEFYLNWQDEMEEFEDYEELKDYLFDQKIVVNVFKGI